VRLSKTDKTIGFQTDSPTKARLQFVTTKRSNAQK